MLTSMVSRLAPPLSQCPTVPRGTPGTWDKSAGSPEDKAMSATEQTLWTPSIRRRDASD